MIGIRILLNVSAPLLLLIVVLLDTGWAFVVPSKIISSRINLLGKDAIFKQHNSLLQSAATPEAEKRAMATSSRVNGNGEKKKSTLASNSNQELLETNYPQFPRTWVPLCSTLELDPKRPTPLEFLGNSYVVFQKIATRDDSPNVGGSNSSTSSPWWVVMDNSCPHRLAPLSEGRIEPETGRLQCSYHGWTFEADGSCTRIPQAVPAVEEAARQNPRSCVKSYTTFVDPSTGILWIWPWKEDALQFAGDLWRHPEGIMGQDIETDEKKKEEEETSAAKINNNKSVKPGTVTYSREVPYGWDTLVENLIDPAHIPFAHHGMQGNRKDAIPINMTRATDRGEAGFSFEWEDRTMGMKRSGMGEFRAPYLVNYDALFDAKSDDGSPRPFELRVLCIPTKPGWSRVITLSGASSKDEDEQDEGTSIESQSKDKAPPKKTKTSAKVSLMRRLFSMLPLWVTHLFSNKFFDSDLAFLHYQEQGRRRNKDRNQRADSSYFMPAESDRSIAALYDWKQKYAPSYTQNQFMQLPPAIYDRSQLFDRWGQHTSKCKVCLQALEGIKKWRKGSQIALVASIVLGFRFWFPRVVAVASLALMKVLSNVENAFYEGEFKHYENH